MSEVSMPSPGRIRPLRTPSRKRHSLLALLRLALTVPIAYAMPMSHSHWGQSYPGDGQQSFGFVLIFGAISLIAALVFLFAGTLAQILFRQRQARYTVFTDVILFVLFTGVLVYMGVTATYSDTTATLEHGSSGHNGST